VNRLFVDIAIKKKLCDYAKSKNEFDSQAETLRRLRVWENHSDHVHVRINCPLNGTKCITQEAPPIGQGCDLAALQAFDANEVGP
jgi:penicillin-insensitive murein endopeptidase